MEQASPIIPPRGMSKKRSRKRGGVQRAIPIKPKRRPIALWLVLGAGALWVAVAASAGGTDREEISTGVNPLDALNASAEVVAQGKAIFDVNCAVCHGAAAKGQDVFRLGGGVRADGSRIAPALNGTAHAWHHPPAELFRHIKTGSPLPDSAMLGWEGRMNDEEIVAVIAYIQSLWPARIRAGYLSNPHH